MHKLRAYVLPFAILVGLLFHHHLVYVRNVTPWLIFIILLLLSNYATDYLKVKKGEGPGTDRKSFFQPPSISGMYLILYGIGRFAIEFLRADPRRTALGLTSNQYVSILFLAAGIVILFTLIPLIALRKKGFAAQPK